MNTEELEQSTEEGQNRNTASQQGSIAGCLLGSAKTLLPVRKTDRVSVSFVAPMPTSQKFSGIYGKLPQLFLRVSMERENSGFSIY